MASSPLFEKVQIVAPKRSVFDLSFEHKLSCNMGYLYPIWVQECIPNDTFSGSISGMVRLAPLSTPMMQNVNLTIHNFFVPNRLLWANPNNENDSWKAFITGGEDGTLTPTPPHITKSDITSLETYLDYGSLADYMGVNVQHNIVQGYSLPWVSALPFRAYQFIYNEYYRDENLVTKVAISLTGGEDDSTDLLTMRMRAWKKDYFTSALPWAQRGDPMTIPFTGAFNPLPAQFIKNSNGTVQNVTSNQFFSGNSSGVLGLRNLTTNSSGFVTDLETTGVPITSIVENTDNALTGIDSSVFNSVRLDVSDSIKNVATINELRIANRVQRFMEKNARIGGRYTEQILGQFGVRVPDYRLQRPEYISGGVMPISISPIYQTSETSGTPQANPAGIGNGSGSICGFSYHCSEHGFIMSILSILPVASYQQGLQRMWTRQDRFDYAFPDFANLGEQIIRNDELYFVGDVDPDTAELGIEDAGTFGYQSRYAEYKFNYSRVSGDFKSTLNNWHLGRIFGNRPALNQDFIEYAPDYRTFAVTSATVDHFFCDFYFRVKAVRPLPFWSNPSLI